MVQLGDNDIVWISVGTSSHKGKKHDEENHDRGIAYEEHYC